MCYHVCFYTFEVIFKDRDKCQLGDFEVLIKACWHDCFRHHPWVSLWEGWQNLPHCEGTREFNPHISSSLARAHGCESEKQVSHNQRHVAHGLRCHLTCSAGPEKEEKLWQPPYFPSFLCLSPVSSHQISLHSFCFLVAANLSLLLPRLASLGPGPPPFFNWDKEIRMNLNNLFQLGPNGVHCCQFYRK